jgi:hypothetical protein
MPVDPEDPKPLDPTVHPYVPTDGEYYGSTGHPTTLPGRFSAVAIAAGVEKRLAELPASAVAVELDFGVEQVGGEKTGHVVLAVRKGSFWAGLQFETNFHEDMSLEAQVRWTWGV